MSDEITTLKKSLRESERKVTTAERTVVEVKRARVSLAGWSAVAGFLLFAIGGQWFPGYQLDSTAEAGAEERAVGAVLEVMAELCAERFMQPVGLESRLTDLAAQSGDWSKSKFIREGAWAKTPAGEASGHNTADRCRVLIGKRVEKGAATAS